MNVCRKFRSPHSFVAAERFPHLRGWTPWLRNLHRSFGQLPGSTQGTHGVQRKRLGKDQFVTGRGRRARAATVIFLAVVLPLNVTSAQSPSISYVFPSAVAPGKTTTLTFFGEHLNGTTELWTTFPSRVTPG